MTWAGRGGQDPLAVAAAIRAGNQNFKGSRRNLGGSRELPLLATPRAHRTAAQQAERVRLEAEEHTAAARNVARRFMKDWHGCTGHGCASPQHGPDRELQDRMLQALFSREQLQALGLRPDPQVIERDEWGNPVKPGKGGGSLMTRWRRAWAPSPQVGSSSWVRVVAGELDCVLWWSGAEGCATVQVSGGGPDAPGPARSLEHPAGPRHAPPGRAPAPRHRTRAGRPGTPKRATGV
jgi:hypothetical protein